MTIEIFSPIINMWATSTFCLLHAVSLCIHLHTHTEKQAVVSGSVCIFICAHGEIGCGIWVSRVSVCWVFLYTSIHTYRETSSGIWVSRVSACCPLHTYLYTHTKKQVVVSGYLGYQPAVLSIYIYTHIQRNKLWYLVI